MKVFTKCVPLFAGNSDEFEPGQYVLLSEAQARITELETAISDVLAGKPKYWPIHCELLSKALLPAEVQSMADDRTDALTDMAYYNGGRHVLAALSGGMDPDNLRAEMEQRVAPARKWLAENRDSLPQRRNQK